MRNISYLLALLVLTSCQPEDTPMPPPNIVLIMADDLGYETLTMNGGESYQTPFLDQLAANGMRFTHAYSNPLCTPSRVKLMTGKYNHRNYIGFGLLDPEQKTFAHALKEAGYATGVFGKWQLYGNERQREMFGRAGSLPSDAGFDEHVLWQIKTRPGSRFKDPTLDINGAAPQEFLGAYGPDIFTDSLIQFMSDNKDQSFLAYFPMALTHDPFQPSPDHPDYAALDPESGLNDPVYFADNIQYMDKLVGRIVASLAELQLEKKTLVMFIGDNGTDRKVTSLFRGDSIRGDKGYPTRYGTHVPMIAYWPGAIQAGTVNDNLIDLSDFFPTMLELAEIPVSDDLDGVSFKHQLLGHEGKERSWVYSNYAPQWSNFEPVTYVHDKEWKRYEDGRIFNVEKDPWEKSPVAFEDLPESARGIIQGFEEVLMDLNGSAEE